VIPRIPALHVGFWLAAASLFALNPGAAAQQQTRSNNLPDAPVAKQAPEKRDQKPNNGALNTTWEILSHKSVFFPDLAYDPRPLSGGQKLELAADQSIAPFGLIASGFTAGISQARNSWPGYRQGAEGYGKRYGATLALNASSDMFGTFLLPSLLRHDPRYFVSARGGAAHKVGYAISRVFITRTDRGGQAFNWSGLLAPLMAESLANVYLPDGERTTGKTFQRYGIHLGIDAAANVAKEFWPRIFKTLRRSVGKPNP
jgi:hypothetical protein